MCALARYVSQACRRHQCHAIFPMCFSSELGNGSKDAFKPACWQCQKPVKDMEDLERFCGSCHALQPPGKQLSYFDILNTDPAFDIDTGALKKRYQSLQRKLHPDLYTRRSQQEQGFSAEHSSLANRALRTLSDPVKRAQHLLALEGMPAKEGDVHPDAAFLMSVMDTREDIDDMVLVKDLDGLRTLLHANTRLFQAEVEQIKVAFVERRLEDAKLITERMVYLHKIHEEISRHLPPE